MSDSRHVAKSGGKVELVSARRAKMSKEQYFVMEPNFGSESTIVTGPLSKKQLDVVIHGLVADHGGGDGESDALEFVDRALTGDDCDPDEGHYRVAIIRDEIVVPRAVDRVTEWTVDS